MAAPCAISILDGGVEDRAARPKAVLYRETGSGRKARRVCGRVLCPRGVSRREVHSSDPLMTLDPGAREDTVNLIAYDYDV